MTEAAIEIILQGAKEKYPEARPRIISDNGPQFIAQDFKEFPRISGMTHVRTPPFCPQSNGKIERWHQSLKGECIRPGTPLSLDDARRLISGYMDHHNNVRLNSAMGYITPNYMLAGRQPEIHSERDRKLDAARKQRQIRRQQSRLTHRSRPGGCGSACDGSMQIPNRREVRKLNLRLSRRSGGLPVTAFLHNL